MTKNLNLLLILFTSLILIGYKFASDFNEFWVTNITVIATMIISGLLMICFDKWKIPSKEKTSFSINHFAGVLIGTMGLLLVCYFIQILGYKIAGVELDSFIKYDKPTRVVTSLLLLAICEEIIFRRILSQKINNAFGFKKSILISSLIFAISHIYTDSGLLIVFIAGMILTYIYLKTNNIYLSIIAHLVYNFSVYYLQPIYIKYIEEISEFSVIILVLFIGIGFILWMSRFLNTKPEGNTAYNPLL